MEILVTVMRVISLLAIVANGIGILINIFEEDDFETAFYQLLAEAYLVLTAIALGHNNPSLK